MSHQDEHPDHYDEHGRLLYDVNDITGGPPCTCPAIDGIPVTGSTCPQHGLPAVSWTVCPGCKELHDEDTTRCAGCGKLFCPDCIEWCAPDYDPPAGDYFCSECQESEGE